jgi:cytochrome c biogenesis protein CcdA
MGIDQLFTAVLAGLLTVINPCVLPMLPIVFASALSEHRAGAIALALGVSVSFVAISLFVALIGFSIGLGSEQFRFLGGLIMILLGIVLVVPRLQVQLATAAGPIANWSQRRFGGSEGRGWQGQFGIGLMLGLVWSPCTGPTMGLASTYASRGDNIGMVALVMLVFGIAAAIPLILLGLLSRAALMRWRDRLLSISAVGKAVFGLILITIGILILTGVDRQFEAYLNRVLPEGLLGLTVKF